MTWKGNRIHELLDYGINDGGAFLPTGKFANNLAKECLELFNLDYICTTIDNSKGVLCSTYPIQMIVPLHQREGAESPEDVGTDLFKKTVLQSVGGRFARTRGRFPVPVLLLGNKTVCRSSTLARSPEIYTRTGCDYFMRGEVPLKVENDRTEHSDSSGASAKSLQTNSQSTENVVCFRSSNGTVSLSQPILAANEANQCKTKGKPMHKMQHTAVNDPSKNKEWLLDRVRKADIELLKTLKVNVICDLMVENKKVKFGMNVTSSEKVDSKKRYRDFDLLSIPYPGCEFFSEYSRNDYTGVGLTFDWKQQFVDAKLHVCDKFSQVNGIDWKDYMQWDLVKLTQNYLKLLLNSFVGSHSSGLLLHCISGWDRTPLFISLLRLSLWADDLIHQSLDAEQIVYLTLAYDWLLFSHQMYDRIYKNEEIMHFCFDFLKDITSPEYSVLAYMDFSKTSNSALFMADGVNENTASFKTENFDSCQNDISGESDTSQLNCHDVKPHCVNANGIHCDTACKSEPITLDNAHCSLPEETLPLNANCHCPVEPNLSNEFSANNGMPLISTQVDGTANTDELQEKLQRRKDRLEMAHSVMLPIYSSVVQTQRKKQESSGLAAMFGSLVDFMKQT